MSMDAKAKKRILTVGCCVVIAAGGYSGFLGIRSMIGPKQPLSHAELMQTPELKAEAEDLKQTIVVPHLEQAIDGGKNVLWCATFQMCWNRSIKTFDSQLASLSEPPMARSLNRHLVTADDLDPDSYVICAAPSGGPEFVAQVEKALDEKFDGGANPELLYRIPSELGPGNWVTYCYLFKHLPFEHFFERSREALDFDGKPVKSFGTLGVRPERSFRLAEQVIVYHFANADEFVLELITESSSDRLILAKVEPGPTLLSTIRSVQAKLDAENPESGQRFLQLAIPVINFDIFRRYDEFAGYYAVQQTRFRLDEKGAALVSEASLGGGGIPATSLIFDKPFLIMIQRVGAKMPYCALWVANAELLVPYE